MQIISCKLCELDVISISEEGICDNCRQKVVSGTQNVKMSELYPAYYKDVTNLDEIDVYMVHHLFQVNDPAGILQHSSKKILLSGVRTGKKPAYTDIREARDSLNRWLAING